MRQSARATYEQFTWGRFRSDTDAAVRSYIKDLA